MMNINKKSVLKYADAYNKQYKAHDERIEVETKRLLKKQRYLKQKELVRIGMWKSKRPKRHYESEENDDLTVKEITLFSFNTKSEKARIKSLLVLKGVSWVVASVILHFAFPSKYAIWDFRVMESLGWENRYDFNSWQKYCNRIRAISKKYNLSVRTVEKALWKYSKEKQKQLCREVRFHMECYHCPI